MTSVNFIKGILVTIVTVLAIPFYAYADITDFTISVCGANFPPCADTLNVDASESGHWSFYSVDNTGSTQNSHVDFSGDDYTYSWYNSNLPFTIYLYDGDCTGLSRAECEASVGSAGFYTWEDNQTGGTYNFENETHFPPEGGGTSTPPSGSSTSTEVTLEEIAIVGIDLLVFAMVFLFMLWLTLV